QGMTKNDSEQHNEDSEQHNEDNEDNEDSEQYSEDSEQYYEDSEQYNEDSEQYNEDSKQHKENLEMKIVSMTDQLLILTELISKYRSGTDVVSKAISTKLRQQIYGVLGNRGFSNMGDKEHPLIVTLRSEITSLMNRYRKITSNEKLLALEDKTLINTIIRQVINIFFFRLKVQEPVAEWKFFENRSSINTIMMEGSWDSNVLEEICVDICSFPVIGSNLCEANKDNKNMKVIFPAQIISKDIPITKNVNRSNNSRAEKNQTKGIGNSKYKSVKSSNITNQTSSIINTKNAGREKYAKFRDDTNQQIGVSNTEEGYQYVTKKKSRKNGKRDTA
ncbi:8483_t:CDS:1, partial [Scutellospora calospora]